MPSLRSARFDWDAALSTALASDLVYEDGAEIVRVCEREWGFSSCEFIASGGTECFVAIDEEVVLIGFRGTKEIRDWLVNLTLVGTTTEYGRVHRGFLGAFEVVRPMLNVALSEVPGIPVVLTGHSLGGALATIAAAEWEQAVPIRCIYTYGQPAVGKGKFLSFMSGTFQDRLFRFVNDDDVVPRLPPTYAHVGQLFHFHSNGQLSTNTEGLTESALADASTSMMTDVDFTSLKSRLRSNWRGQLRHASKPWESVRE